jgi:hypothetical protein
MKGLLFLKADRLRKKPYSLSIHIMQSQKFFKIALKGFYAVFYGEVNPVFV